MGQNDYFSKTRPAVESLIENGLTPFDLLEWTHLLDLAQAVRPLLGLDINVRADNKEEINNALIRKAEALDKRHKTDLHKKIAKDIWL